MIDVCISSPNVLGVFDNTYTRATAVISIISVKIILFIVLVPYKLREIISLYRIAFLENQVMVIGREGHGLVGKRMESG